MKTPSRSKNWLFALLILCFITPAYSQINTPSTATVPFGSKIAASANPYGYGIIPATLPTGSYTPSSNLYGKSQDAYTAYNSWKTKYVQACGSQYRVLFDDGSSTVSEGIGYGMLLAAYAADKALFDGLWAYYKANSNSNGLMNWKMSGCTGTAGSNGATDADLDAAMALIVASKQWPSATSPYTYSTEATTLITAIKTYEIQTTSFQAINGDGWGMSSTCRNPSYQSPAYYRQFATQVSSQASTWNSAVTAAYTLLNANRNTTTGLVSNWSDPSGAPNSCNGSNEYGYDACRNPWRMAVEVLWTGNSTAQTNFCVPIAAYINGKGAANAGGPVPQSGGSGTVNATFVSTYAAGICGATSTYQTIMNSMYTQTVNTVDASGYFGNTLRVISLFVQTGNFWNPSTLTASPVTVSLTAPSAGNYTEGTSVTLTASASTTSGTISKVEFYYGTTLIGTSTSSPYSMSWTIPTSGNLSITAIAYNSSSATATSSPVALNVYKAINQTSTAPTIDGTVDAVWSNNNSGSLNNVISGTISNAADLSGTFKALWDNTYVYLLVDVTDNTLINDSGTNKYDDDNIEVFFDIGNTKATTVGSNYFQYMFRWNDATVTEANSKSTTGITFAHVAKTGGYITEIRIPWSTMSNTPALNQLVGFDVEVDDDDDGGTRDGKMSWFASADQAWTNPSYAGTAILLGSSCTSPSAAGSITGSTSVCAGATSLTYSITAVTNATGYTWTVPTGASITAGSGTNSITVTMGTTSGTVTVTPTNSCGNGTASSTTVTVNAVVTPSVSASSSATTICAGTSITLTATPTNGGTAPTYQWKKGGTAISGATNATYTTTTAANNDSYTVTMTSNATCPSTASVTSSAVVITVNAVVTPSVSVSSSATTICAGTSITLTATPTNGGTAPTYQWKKGGTAISGATNATYTTTTAANNDSYTVTMTSNATCPSTASVTSSAVVITVNAVVTPSVSVSSSATTICAGTSITLTATPTNGGTAPTYQWKKGGTAISGATNATYTTTTAANNDSYTVTMTSNATCPSTASVTSSAVVITVNAVVTPSVSASSSATTICAGTSITLTATPTNGGTAPTYQWKKGGTAISGATNATYTTTTAANNDSYTVTMTSNATCPSTASVTSSAVVITVNAVVTPSISASSSATTICAGTSITLTATPTNGGTAPTYQWKKGGTAISGATNATYTTTTAANNDSYTVTMTSNATCPSTASVTSSAVVITVNAVVTPSVSANSSATTICAGTSITLTATPTNGGTAPTYQWKKGGTAISGATNATYTTTTAANNDSYTVTMTSNATCPSTASVTSSAVVITVNAVVTPSVSASSSATTICAGTSITLTATPTNGGTAPTYQWKKGGTAISGATNATYTTTTAANNDSYTVTMTSNATCPSTASVTSSAVVITVSTSLTPTISIDVTPGTVIYAGQSVTFGSTSTNGGTSPTYQWKNGGIAISGETNASYTTTTLNNNDAISVTMTSNATCATTAQVNSNSIQMTVNASPVFDSNVSGPTSVTANQTSVTYSVSNQAGMTYVWSVPPGATIVSGQGTNTIVVDFGTSSGNITLVETNPVGQTSTIVLAVNVGTTTPVLVSSAETSIKIYPIPCSEQITIELSESTSTEVSYILIDVVGNIVLTNTQIYSGAPIDIKMPVASGMYHLIVTWDDHKAIQKIIKQ